MAARLSELLNKPVIMAEDVVGPDARAKAAALKPGEILLLENTRFEQARPRTIPALAKKLASMADLYVSDAFGAVHRAHASTAGVAAYLPAVSGFLIQKELEFLGGAIADPKRPLVAILGGSKVSSQDRRDQQPPEHCRHHHHRRRHGLHLLRRPGRQGGRQPAGGRLGSYANDMVEKAKAKGVKLLLPVDTVCGDKFAPDAQSQVVKAGEIPDGWQGLDIGPETVKLYCGAVADAAP